ncbi:unnamed protein product, partial [Symbiodinium necroappetens]
MSVRPRLDDPAALVALLDQLSASPAVRTALSNKGFASLGSLAFAVSDLSDADEVRLFLRSTLLLFEASSAAPPKPALGTPALPPAPPASASASKIAVPDLLHLRKTFLAKYPGELLTPDSAPSVDFLSLLKNHHDSQQSLWVPWRLRTSESDATRWEEARRPRNDRQLLRSLLDADAEPASASINLNMQGPPDPVLRRSLSLFATALAMLDLVHLATIKKFNDRFLHLSLTPPMDASLRGPSLQEIVLADRSVWASVSELIRDHGWSLSDSLNQIAFCESAAGQTASGDSPAKPKGKAKAKVLASPPAGDAAVRLPATVVLAASPASPTQVDEFQSESMNATPAKRFFLDLFAGASSPVSQAVADLGLARLEPVDVLVGPAHDLLDDSTFQLGNWRRQRFCIPAHVTCCIWWQVIAWCRLTAPFMATVAACQVGLQLHKSWSFCCNDASVSQLASVCPHPIGFHPAVSGKRAADGSFLTRNTAAYPASLALSLAQLAAPWLSKDTSGTAPVALATWHSLLPTRLPWPDLMHRVEDGAGTCSTARPDPAKFSDPFRSLRTSWSRRFLRDGLAARIATALNSGSREPPLSESELEPFLSDLRSFLGVTDDAAWRHLLRVQSGQPFRLELWHRLCVACADPDTEYFDLLREGVPLGISSPIPPCKVMAPPGPPDSATIPLQHCESSWKSAIDHSETVDELLLEELAQGWIAIVPGGDDELRREYSVSAVGKLGVVLAEGRPPRLVVDSSVSGVTCHTALPNRSCNPTLTDVFSSMPLSDSLERLVALVLDVAKAHRRILIRKQDRGLLCFRHNNVLYQCTTLNFGARVSSFFWARAAGLLLRLIHRLLRVRHSAKFYVDDLLCLLDSASAPVWASHVVVLLLLIRVPLSWHKCALSQRVVWIGWEIDLAVFTVRL